MKTLSLLAGVLVMIAMVATAVPAAELRAGAVGWTAGQAGITVPLTPAVSAPYTVVVQQTNTAGYSPSAECTYFNVLKETSSKFEVQHKTCKDGTPQPLDGNVTLKWVLITH
jgi:hypothetical protein